MTRANNLQFQTYLQSISHKYKHWWSLYTLTDAEGKKREEKQFSSPFDFGLIVKTFQPKQEKEKTERLPVLEGIRKYASNHVLLIGKPGSGKSTALARLLLEEAQVHLKINSQVTEVNDAIIPILVELRYWQTSVFERIQAFLQQHDGNLNIDETILKTLLRQGKFLLLIDGVNELPSEDARRQIAAFRKDYPQTPMIFTTRDLGVGGDLGIEKKLEMQPLNETQMREFVMAYLPQQGKEMLKCFGHRLQEFGKTPLLLWMLCELFKQTGNIPPNLGMVFRLFTQSYENSDKLKGDVPITAESRRWWNYLLEHLAFVMMQGESVTEFRVAIPKREIEEIFTQYLTAEKFEKPRYYAKHWLEDLLRHHLIQVGTGDKIEFHHQLLQEYYAAEYLLRQLPHTNNDKLQHDYLNLLKWTEPVAIMLTLVDNEAQALQVVQLALNVDLMLGARLVGEVKPEFQQQTVNLILNEKFINLLEIHLLDISRSDYTVSVLINALNNENSDVRLHAVDTLGEIGSEKAVDSLINALNDEDFYVRARTTGALGKIGSERAVDALINTLNNENSDVRHHAANALGKIGSERTVDALINALNNENSDARNNAANALGKIGGERAVDALINALNNENSDVRHHAANGLGEIGSERAVDALINVLNNQDLYSYCALSHALDALGKIGNEKAVDALINALIEEDLSVRKNAANALGEIGSERAVDALINALNDKKLYFRDNAANALGKIGSERAVDALINALNDENFCLCWRAADALGKIDSEKAITPIVNIFFKNIHLFPFPDGDVDYDSDVDYDLIDSDIPDFTSETTNRKELELIKERRVIDVLINALNENDENLFVDRLSCEHLEEQIINERLVITLINDLNDESSSVRLHAAHILVEIGSKKIINTLINALNHESSSVRFHAADALKKISSEKTIDALINIFEDIDSYEVYYAIDALKKIGSERAIDALIIFLNHEKINELSNESSNISVDILLDGTSFNYDNLTWNVRSAVDALGEIGSEKAVDALINTLNNENSGIRKSAADSLEEIGSEKAVDFLINALNDEDVIARYYIACALGRIASSDKLTKIWQLVKNGTIIGIDGRDPAVYIILNIQKRCKFYNHDIFHSPPVEDENSSDTPVQKILILAANPKNTSQLRLDEEVREIDEGLRRANKRDLFQLEQKWAVRERDFYRAILDTQPQIVHFCGHGEGEDGILLEDETGQTTLINADALASMFKLFATKGVECVVLNACYSEVQAEAISQHIDYVIGMNQAIGDKAAIKFAVAFYDALGAGEAVEFAFDLGCSQLVGLKEHQTPILKKNT